jgi:RND superfamily putative drug exporter
VVAAGLVQLDVVDDYATDLSRIDGIARVDAPSGSYVDGLRVVPAGPAHAGLIGADGSFFNAIPSVDPTSGEAEEVVAEIRAGEAPVAVQVTGRSAFLVDTKAAIFGALPWALGIIGAVTFVVLFLMFGSVLVPAKAVVLNLLSLSATFGSLVWIFQDGHLSSLLDFTATGGLEMTMPILMFAIAFGLSMDYEVFLLSRIKEEHDAGADTVASVATGLERTGRIVTAAALLMSVVFIAFAISDVSFMKMFGIGMTLAVLVDAFVVRTTLVPAFMRLAGKANWWAPRWMKRLYERFGIREHIALDGPLPNLETA